MSQRLQSILAIALALTSQAFASTWIERADVQGFIDEMSLKHGFNREKLITTFSQVSLKPNILPILDRPSTSRPYYEFRPKFVNTQNIASGVRYWQQHAELISKISTQYQVEPEYLIAILGVETQWGKNMGSFRVMDALSTIAFDYPRRADYFRKELSEFLLLAREENQDPFSFKGSYAGAMGMAQFMPSSFHNYAQDWDGDHHRDIWKNHGDGLASIANYFARHGWKAGEPLVLEAKIQGDGWKKLVEDKFNLHYRISELSEFGVTPMQTEKDGQLPSGLAASLAVLAPLETAQGVSRYWLGLNNFYVITRYNRSTLYAMAVHELAQGIRESYERAPKPEAKVKSTARQTKSTTHKAQK